MKQKLRFLYQEGGPLSAENVLHVIDLGYVPIIEQAIVKANILQGARDEGGGDGFQFINDATNL